MANETTPYPNDSITYNDRTILKAVLLRLLKVNMCYGCGKWGTHAQSEIHGKDGIRYYCSRTCGNYYFNYKCPQCQKYTVRMNTKICSWCKTEY